jgi:hypothetical protein
MSLIAFQLLLKAKMNRVVVNMTVKEVLIDNLVDVTSHMAAICGSALVTAAMVP